MSIDTEERRSVTPRKSLLEGPFDAYAPINGHRFQTVAKTVEEFIFMCKTSPGTISTTDNANLLDEAEGHSPSHYMDRFSMGGCGCRKYFLAWTISRPSDYK